MADAGRRIQTLIRDYQKRFEKIRRLQDTNSHAEAYAEAQKLLDSIQTIKFFLGDNVYAAVDPIIEKTAAADVVDLQKGLIAFEQKVQQMAGLSSREIQKSHTQLTSLKEYQVVDTTKACEVLYAIARSYGEFGQYKQSGNLWEALVLSRQLCYTLEKFTALKPQFDEKTLCMAEGKTPDSLSSGIAALLQVLKRECDELTTILQPKIRQIEQLGGSGDEDDIGESERLACETMVEFTGKNCDIWFDRIVGLTDAKQTLRMGFIRPIQFPNLFGSVAKGVLLYGLPGTGKTMLIKAAVNELTAENPCIKILFFAPQGADLKGKYVGETEKKILGIYRGASSIARKRAKKETSGAIVIAVIFIDEIDSIAASGRGGADSMAAIAATSVNTLLQVMDGFGAVQNIITIGATNYPWKIDPAVLRRFTYPVPISLPTEEDIKSLIDVETYSYYKAFVNYKVIEKLYGPDGGKKMVAKDCTVERPLCGKSAVDDWRSLPIARRVRKGLEGGDLTALCKVLHANRFSGSDVSRLFSIAVRNMGQQALEDGRFVELFDLDDAGMFVIRNPERSGDVMGIEGPSKRINDRYFSPTLADVLLGVFDSSGWLYSQEVGIALQYMGVSLDTHVVRRKIPLVSIYHPWKPMIAGHHIAYCALKIKTALLDSASAQNPDKAYMDSRVHGLIRLGFITQVKTQHRMTVGNFTVNIFKYSKCDFLEASIRKEPTDIVAASFFADYSQELGKEFDTLVKSFFKDYSQDLERDFSVRMGPWSLDVDVEVENYNDPKNTHVEFLPQEDLRLRFFPEEIVVEGDKTYTRYDRMRNVFVPRASSGFTSVFARVNPTTKHTDLLLDVTIKVIQDSRADIPDGDRLPLITRLKLEHIMNPEGRYSGKLDKYEPYKVFQEPFRRYVEQGIAFPSEYQPFWDVDSTLLSDSLNHVLGNMVSTSAHAGTIPSIQALTQKGELKYEPISGDAIDFHVLFSVVAVDDALKGFKANILYRWSPINRERIEKTTAVTQQEQYEQGAGIFNLSPDVPANWFQSFIYFFTPSTKTTFSESTKVYMGTGLGEKMDVLNPSYYKLIEELPNIWRTKKSLLDSAGITKEIMEHSMRKARIVQSSKPPVTVDVSMGFNKFNLPKPTKREGKFCVEELEKNILRTCLGVDEYAFKAALNEVRSSVTEKDKQDFDEFVKTGKGPVAK